MNVKYGVNTIKLAQLDQKKVKLRDMKNVIIEIRNSVVRLYSRLDIIIERISKWEERAEEIIRIQFRGTKNGKHNILREKKYRMESPTQNVISFRGRKQRGQGTGNIKRFIGLEFSSIEEGLRSLYSRIPQNLSRVNTKKFISEYIIVNLKYNTKDKDKMIIKAARKKQRLFTKEQVD